MFTVDHAGLAAILERRGKFFAVAELISNAWDSGTDRVRVSLAPVPGQPLAELAVEDWGDGFENLADAYTLFARSRRASDASKRGRFSLGEKLVLAVCKSARIESIGGGIRFEEGQRHNLKSTRDRGTLFEAVIKMTREEYAEVCEQMKRILPPVPTTFNGVEIETRPSYTYNKLIGVKLPTEIAGEDGTLRRTIRACEVEIHKDDSGPGQLLELGIPIVETSNGWRVNILQKVPLNFDRDNVHPSYLRSVESMLLNLVAPALTPEEASLPWAQEAAGDARTTPDTVKEIVMKRFGDRVVIATPNDPLANAQAEAAGYTVVPGGSLSAAAWANVKKANAILPSSRVFPSATPEQRALAAAQADAVNAAMKGKCPTCGTPIAPK